MQSSRRIDTAAVLLRTTVGVMFVAHAALVERLPAFGQRQPARRPVEKAYPEVRLEVGDLARDGRHGEVEPIGRARKAAGLDDLCEGKQ